MSTSTVALSAIIEESGYAIWMSRSAGRRHSLWQLLAAQGSFQRNQALIQSACAQAAIGSQHLNLYSTL